MRYIDYQIWNRYEFNPNDKSCCYLLRNRSKEKAIELFEKWLQEWNETGTNLVDRKDYVLFEVVEQYTETSMCAS